MEQMFMGAGYWASLICELICAHSRSSSQRVREEKMTTTWERLAAGSMPYDRCGFSCRLRLFHLINKIIKFQIILGSSSTCAGLRTGPAWVMHGHLISLQHSALTTGTLMLSIKTLNFEKLGF